MSIRGRMLCGRRNLLVFQVEIDCTLPIDAHQLPVVNGVEVLRFLRVAMDGNNFSAEESMVAAHQFGYYLALIGYGDSLDNRRFDNLGRGCLEPGGGEIVHGTPCTCA